MKDGYRRLEEDVENIQSLSIEAFKWQNSIPKKALSSKFNYSMLHPDFNLS